MNTLSLFDLQNRDRTRFWRHQYTDHNDGLLSLPDPRTPEQRDQGAELLFRLGSLRRERILKGKPVADIRRRG